MVTVASSLTSTGLRDWLWQRLSAVYLVLYCIGVFVYFKYCSKYSSNSFANTYDFFIASLQITWFKVANLIALVSILVHAYIGIWTILTDYIKCTVLRLSLHCLVILELLLCLLWGAKLLIFI